MYYAPHILKAKVYKELEYDENGNPIMEKNDEWEKIGPCRCDDNGQMKQVSVNGSMVDFSYHIVYEGKDVLPDMEVIVTDSSGGVRGAGKVIKINRCNYLKYSEIWV